MDSLKKNGLELVVAFWLLVVAVQYISSYFFPLGLDFRSVYYAMIAFIVACSIVKILVHPSSNVDREQPLETIQCEDRRAGGRKSRRSQR